MEPSINRVELLGRTGNRPTLRRTPNDTPVVQRAALAFFCVQDVLLSPIRPLHH